MNLLVDSHLSQLVGWCLLHFIWQGMLIASLVALLSVAVSARRANLRYLVCCVGLMAMACSPVVTFFMLSPAEVALIGIDAVPASDAMAGQQDATSDGDSVSSQISESNLGVEGGVTSSAAVVEWPIDGNNHAISEASDFADRFATTSSFSFYERLQEIGHSVVPVLTVGWTLGVTLLSLKLTVSWLRVRRLRRSGTLIENPQMIALLEQLKRRLRITIAIPLRESVEVHSPMVIGWLKPVILLPASAISGLSQHQLSAILIHELAHIRRADYVVNLLQCVIETLLFYHPAVWWLSRRIRNEREHCCDDLAVAVSGDRRAYVKALLKLESSKSCNTFAVSSSGGDLVNRVARILGRESKSATLSNWLTVLTSFGVVAGLVLGSWLDVSNVEIPVQQDTEAVEQVDDEESDIRKIKVRVVSPDGKPVFNASITLGVWYAETAETLNFTTDKDGIAELPVPKRLRIYRLWAGAVGYTPLFANWEEHDIKEGTLPPDEFVFKMIEAVEIGGIVVDEDGQPISDTAVEVKGNGGGAKPEGRIRLSTNYARRDSVKTDAEGRWRVANIPPGDDVVISLKVNHPDFISDENWGDMQAAASIGLKELRNQSAKIVMAKGIQIRGTVTDEDGKPVADALVVWGDYPYRQEGSQEMYTDADGRYETPTQKSGDIRITIVAPGYAPQMTMVDVGPELKDTDFVMSAGNRLELRFVDENGKAVPNAYAQVESWRQVSSLYNHRHPNVLNSGIPIQSDSDGIYVWDWAPEDAVSFNFSARGYTTQRRFEVIAGDAPTAIVMKKPKRWAGKVTDNDGNPIPSFSVIPRLHLNDKITRERRRDVVKGIDGQFVITIKGQDGDYSLLLEAEGFESKATEEFPLDSPPEELIVQMNPAIAKTYRVVDEAGDPVPDATVLAFPTDQRASIRSYLAVDAIKQLRNTKTGPDGFFSIPNSESSRTLIAFTPKRYGEICDRSENDVAAITIREWATLDCYVKKDGEPWHTKNFLRENRYHDGSFFHIQQYRLDESDVNGVFTENRVAPIPHAIDIFGKNRPADLRYQIAFQPKPGEAFEIDFTDCPSFTATIKFSEASAKKADPATAKFSLRSLQPYVQIPAELLDEIQENNLDVTESSAVIEWYRERLNFDARKCFENCFDKYYGPLEHDGLIATDILRRGKYELTISSRAVGTGEPLAEFSKIIDIKDGVNELGTITVPVSSAFRQPAANSLVEDFQFIVRGDKTKATLSTFQNSYVLLDFWSPWSEKSKEYTPKIQRLARMLAAKKKTTMISLMSLDRGRLVRVPSKVPKGLVWVDGQLLRNDLLRVHKKFGVWRPQHLVLIDPNGKYVAGGSFGAVVKKMEELGLK